MSDVTGGRLVGRTISHYRVVAPVGSGGMGVVYRAEDVRLGRPVAIKFVAEDLANDPQAVARLHAEARAASALNHPNICTIYDIGTEDGHPFIVMELMEGQTLRERLTRSRLKVHELVDVGIQIADALQAAHSAGIVHRDIKPANVFMSGRGHVKILDFGLAKVTDSPRGSESETLAGPELTALGTTIGTVSYMSPEQATGEELDPRTDLFSLGVVLYECATGRQPFDGKTPAVILSAILNRAPVLPSVLNPELPVRLQDVIMTCLEKDRELRYQSAADLRADLKRIRRDLESGRSALGHSGTISMTDSDARGVAPSAARSAASLSAQRNVASGSSQPEGAPRRTRVGAVVVVAALALAATAYAVWPRRSAAPAVASGSSVTAARADDRLALARSNLAARNFQAARSYAADVLAANPDQAEARRIRDEADAALARVDQAIALARERLAANDVAGASRALDTASDIDPGNSAISALAAQVAERTRVVGSTPTARNGATTSARSSQPSVNAGIERPQPSSPPRASSSPTTASSASASAATPPPAPAPPPPSVPVQVAPAATLPPQVSSPTVAVTPPPAPVSQTEPARTAPSRPTPPPATTSVGDDTRAATAASGRAEDEAAVRRVVTTYGRAIESKDIALFRSVKPNLSRDEERRLQEGFRTVSSQQVRLAIVSVDVREQAATVVAQRHDVIEAGGRRQSADSRQTFTLARTPGGWVITDIR